MAILVAAALQQTKETVLYDPSYVKLRYPGGDPPRDRGVCSDVIVRAFRSVGIDLQVRVHEDMRAHFREYPRTWSLNAPDPNIDHRRVLNLMTYFRRQGKARPVTNSAADYQPADIVAWTLPGNLPHIGLVVNSRTLAGRPKIVHNVGAGAALEDVLFEYPIIGHYRYF